MPRYRFTCLACDETFEEKRPFSQADPAAICPACHSDQTKKLFGAVAFIVNRGTIPAPVSNGGGCCGEGQCGCQH